MIITGHKSICCGAAVKERNKYANVKTPKEWGDEIYICKGCRKPREAYFTARIERQAEETA
jgi:predicted RNA-binding Zn-ribbon protein involved in translation (DUF1610 family)